MSDPPARVLPKRLLRLTTPRCETRLRLGVTSVPVHCSRGAMGKLMISDIGGDTLPREITLCISLQVDLSSRPLIAMSLQFL